MEKLDFEIKRKFIKCTGFPIQVLDSPYFEYFLDLYEPTLGSKTAWTSFQKEISENFEGKPEKWMEHRREVKYNAIDSLKEIFYREPDEEPEGEIKKNLYSSSNLGKKFLSIDLSRANFQALRWNSPHIGNTWEDFLGRFTSSPSLLGSKNFRQAILGKTNQSGLKKIEKYLIWKVTKLVSPHLPDSFSLFSRQNDEVIWKLPEDYEITEEFRKILLEATPGIDIKVKVFKLDMIQGFTHGGTPVTGFIKTYDNGKSELKDVPKIYYPQVYKAWKGLDLNLVYDLVFLYEGEIARFDYSLSFMGNEK